MFVHPRIKQTRGPARPKGWPCYNDSHAYHPDLRLSQSPPWRYSPVASLVLIDSSQLTVNIKSCQPAPKKPRGYCTKTTPWHVNNKEDKENYETSCLKVKRKARC
uniref:Uncharacterized protein n=1 Tax=Timema poppense TaxID=170557 RepID=A0A7R9HHM1_TIMPO|nr:unnamed protein product [Timema poppensis]